MGNFDQYILTRETQADPIDAATLIPGYRGSTDEVTRVSVGQFTLAAVDAVNSQTPVGLICNTNEGALLKGFSPTVTSNGTVITFTIDPGGEDPIQAIIDNEVRDLDPETSVELTPGTDTVPFLNYVFITYDPITRAVALEAAAVLPESNFAMVATVYVKSAAKVQTDPGHGIVLLRKTPSTICNGNGISTATAQAVGSRPAQWVSGGAVSVAGDGTATVTLSATSTTMVSVRGATTGAISSPAKVYLVNHPTTKWLETTNVATTSTATGVTVAAGQYLVLVVGIVAGEDGSAAKLFVQLPQVPETDAQFALTDAGGVGTYEIPAPFAGRAVLLSRLVLKRSQPPLTTWTIHAQTDLRGAGAVGSGGGATVTEFPDSSFQVYGSTSPTSRFRFEVDALPSGTTVLTVPAGSSLAGTMAVFVPPPASVPTSPGVPGQLAIDANYLYVCYAADTWKRYASVP